MPSHGSLTKSGKVRKLDINNIKWRINKNNKKLRGRRKPIPRVRNRRNYVRRVLHKRKEYKKW